MQFFIFFFFIYKIITVIFFKKKYSLINGFDAAFREGRKTERYARRVGLVELVLGTVLLAASVISLFFL